MEDHFLEPGYKVLVMITKFSTQTGYGFGVIIGSEVADLLNRTVFIHRSQLLDHDPVAKIEVGVTLRCELALRAINIEFVP